RRRRNLWLVVTLLVFLAHNFWFFMAAAGLLLAMTGRRDPNPLALFLFLLFAAPGMGDEIPGFGLARQVLTLNYPRLLALTLLLPAALALVLDPAANNPAAKWPDRLLAAYIGLNLLLQLNLDTFTNTLRYGLYYGMDIVLPYYVASRGLRKIEHFRDALMAFAVAALVLAAIGAFEFAKGWLLYSTLDDVLGVSWAYGGYLQRGESLRALASTGQPIALGFTMAVACGVFLYLRSAVASRSAWLLGMGLLLLGLVAPVSRGPWLGAALGYVAFVATGPKPLEPLGRLAFIGLVAAPLLFASPLGDKLVASLPFIGSEANDTFVYRQQLLEMSLGLIREHPLFGSFDFLKYMEDLRQGQGIVDIVNTYLGVALTSGLTGLSLFVSFFLAVAAAIFRALRAGSSPDGETALLGRVLLATLAGILTIIFTVSSITVIPIIYWSMAGLGLAYVRLAAARPVPASSPPSPTHPSPAPMAGFKA
ncbi:MAG: O-antigen ligase family protein, partial [Actinomycetota bacterium]